MTRIRLALLAVALGLGIPVALLAWRALEGLALERAVRHQALAERAFDEMERALSEWLAAEEARPFEHYRFYVTQGERSPLAEPTHEFVIGAFQVDPDGRVHTPMQPLDEAAARARGDWPPSPERLAAIERVTQLARETWKQEAPARTAALEQRLERKPGKKDDEARAQDPGTTRALQGPLLDEMQEIAKLREDRDAAREDEGVSLYSALDALNLGADQRAERKQKTSVATLPDGYGYTLGETLDEAPEPQSAGAALEPGGEPGAAQERSEWREGDAGLAAAEAPRPQPQTDQLRALGYVLSESSRPPAPATVAPVAPQQAQRRDAAEPAKAVRLTLDPMVGRAAGDDVLLLHRTVLVDTQGYRQGLALDRAKLAHWLEARALGSGGLSQIARLSFGSDAPPQAPGESFVFQHRFAEPFDALSAQLALVALPGVGSPGAIYALVALLALVGTAGLLAVHRMVAVAVHFAERRSNFVAAVTHELKTPLTAIRMYAEMLRDGLVPSEGKRREYYGTITDESERLSRLIDNVLEFSRLERGTREMSFRVGPLEPVVREAAEKLRAHATQQGFAIELDLAPDLPPVRYDRDALLQVLFNLVDNAMKYAGAGPQRRVRIEARRNGAGVQLAVRDFGPGVAGRHLSKIFEPFYRGEDELTRNTKGTGIGLALVRDLAERMGARVRGDNAEGGGFRVSLAFEPAGG